MSVVVRADGLGKRFRQTLPRFDTLLGRLRTSRAAGSFIWALRDLSFQVERGECFGVSGPNGAGKTTLLRLIAGILEPSEGRIEVRGKAQAFLSLHAALHPELSVLENIEICGVLGGLSRKEIARRTEAILDFAGLSDRAEVRMAELSAGQSARVSFSTAIHADPEILLVDETLSVGDAAFQEKCEKTFETMRTRGTTILTASHDEALLDRISTMRLRLENGKGSLERKPQAVRVLFIGNSQIYWKKDHGTETVAVNDVPSFLKHIGGAFQKNVLCETLAVRNAGLAEHWESGEAIESIRSGRWDYVVFQEESSRPLEASSRFETFAKRFALAAREAGAEPVFLMNWPKREDLGSVDRLEGVFGKIERSLQARIAYAGRAWKTVSERRPDWPLYAPDGVHPDPGGAWIAALSLAKTLFRDAPQEIRFKSCPVGLPEEADSIAALV